MDFIGVDGCRAGWFWVGLDASGRYAFGIAQITDELAAIARAAKRVLIDVPISLRDEGTQERLCDLEARRALGRGRGSSVFPVPTRPALYARTYEAACRINARICGRRLSRQSWEIAPKIRDIDELLRSRPRLRAIVRESHPELCFARLNELFRRPREGHKGEVRPMAENKKREAGRAERLAVLRRCLRGTDAIVRSAAETYRRKDVALDDIVDALALAVTASRARLRTLPLRPERDAFGLKMEIVFAG